MEIENKVLKLIKEPLEKEGIAIDSVSYLREDNNNFLRIVIDKEPFIDVDTCVTATKIINPIIDSTDIIKDAYILDVCSKEKGGNNNGC